MKQKTLIPLILLPFVINLFFIDSTEKVLTVSIAIFKAGLIWLFHSWFILAMVRNAKKWGTKKGLNQINNLQIFVLSLGGSIIYLKCLFSFTFVSPEYLGAIGPLINCVKLKKGYLLNYAHEKHESFKLSK